MRPNTEGVSNDDDDGVTSRRASSSSRRRSSRMTDIRGGTYSSTGRGIVSFASDNVIMIWRVVEITKCEVLV